MPYEEKRNILSLFTLILISIPYLVHVVTRYNTQVFASSQEEITFWVTAILIIIPIRIVAEIIGHIVMAILSSIITGKEDMDTSADERDNMISLYSTRNTYIGTSIVIVTSLVAMLINPSISLFFAMLIIGGTVVECVEIASKAIMYRVS